MDAVKNASFGLWLLLGLGAACKPHMEKVSKAVALPVSSGSKWVPDTADYVVLQKRISAYDHYLVFEPDHPGQPDLPYLYPASDIRLVTLSREEIALVEALVLEEVERQYKLPVHASCKIDPVKLRGYKRQYVPFYTREGEKVVWVNCLCDVFGVKRWRKSVVQVNDGGNCYFNLLINLSRGQALGLQVNGES